MSNPARGMFLTFGKETPEIKHKRFEALKKAYEVDQKRLDTDPNSWWNKVKTITFEEGKSMPENYLLKYIDKMNFAQEYYDAVRIDSRDTDPRYSAHKDIWKLITDKQREAKALKLAARIDTPGSPSAADPNLLKMQPRNVNIPNYNFEQYKEFTKLHNREMEKDRLKQYQIKRIFKYIKQHPDQSISKSWKRKLLFGEAADDYNVDKFVDQSVSIEGFKPPVSKRLRRVYIRTRTSRDITSKRLLTYYDRLRLLAKLRQKACRARDVQDADVKDHTVAVAPDPRVRSSVLELEPRMLRRVHVRRQQP